MPGALPQREAATYLRSIGQRDFKDVRKYHLLHFLQLLIPGLSQQIGHNATSFSWIHVFLVFASRCQPIFFHHPLDTIFSHLEQNSELAMSQSVICFMPGFNGDSYLLIFFRLFSLQIEGAACYPQCASHLTFRVGTARLTQLMRQFHLLCACYLPSSPEAFFRISFCTVSSPMIFFKSSGD